ncbi:hypothetical protein, partial [Tsukamurella pulmonis]
MNGPARGSLTVRVVPAVPSHAADRVRVLSVERCRAHLAGDPSAGARIVENRPARGYRRPPPGLRVGAPAAPPV